MGDRPVQFRAWKMRRAKAVLREWARYTALDGLAVFPVPVAGHDPEIWRASQGYCSDWSNEQACLLKGPLFSFEAPISPLARPDEIRLLD